MKNKSWAYWAPSPLRPPSCIAQRPRCSRGLETHVLARANADGTVATRCCGAQVYVYLADGPIIIGSAQTAWSDSSPRRCDAAEAAALRCRDKNWLPRAVGAGETQVAVILDGWFFNWNDAPAENASQKSGCPEPKLTGIAYNPLWGFTIVRLVKSSVMQRSVRYEIVILVCYLSVGARLFECMATR